jgi:hypothetical protein
MDKFFVLSMVLKELSSLICASGAPHTLVVVLSVSSFSYDNDAVED